MTVQEHLYQDHLARQDRHKLLQENVSLTQERTQNYSKSNANSHKLSVQEIENQLRQILAHLDREESGAVSKAQVGQVLWAMGAFNQLGSHQPNQLNNMEKRW